MALATTCPACSTSFKVNPEQLKLRRGLVRCGKCDHVFSGVEYLRYVSDARTDEELNEDNDGQDRRKGDRRGSGRRLWGDSTPAATDELKTAFFLPDTELGPGESASEGPGNGPLSRADSDDADAADTPVDSRLAEPTNDESDASHRDAITDDEVGVVAGETGVDTQNPAGESSGQSAQGASGKRNRRGGARGKRGRARRKRAAARQNDTQTTPETHASIESPGKLDSIGNGDAEHPVQDADLGQSQNGDSAGQSEPEKPSPFSSRAQTRAGSVITSPLTKGARSDFQRAGRDDHWPSSPVWPKIDEHFDEPDIEEPDTKPGLGNAESDRNRQAGQASSVDSAARIGANDQPAPGVDTAKTPSGDLSVLASGDGPHEEDAIDFFGKSSRASVDFDLPPRQVLVLAGALVLLLVLQLAIGNRNVLASRFPAISGSLAALSAPLGLDVQLPMNREAIKIASFDLTAASSREPDASYVMNLLMRNNARYDLRWPAIELTLLDGVGGILVRKVLMPAEYLPDESLITTGLPGSSEQPIRVALKSSTDAPVGYSVSLFYP